MARRDACEIEADDRDKGDKLYDVVDWERAEIEAVATPHLNMLANEQVVGEGVVGKERRDADRKGSDGESGRERFLPDEVRRCGRRVGLSHSHRAGQWQQSGKENMEKK